MFRKVLIFSLVVLFATTAFVSRGLAAYDCTIPTADAAQKQLCQQQLNDLEKQLADLTAKSNALKGQAGTLKGDVTLLTAQINALKTKIKARSVAIAQLKTDITEKASTIETLQEKIIREHQSLAQLLRKTNEMDSNTIVNLVLSDNTISDFYSDVESFQSIKRSVKESVQAIDTAKTKTESEKAVLQDKQNKELDAKAELEMSQKQVAKNQTEKQQLLSITNSNISEYEKQKAAKAALAAKIRAALFNLRDTGAIPFGKALEYANAASQKTGVRPAFLLAILTQESNLGTDQGSCYLTDPTTGTGFGIRRGIVVANVMKPTRDVGPFLEITKSLGRDPYKTLVSCPIGGYGYGGAMGPAQFIPSTWKMFISRLSTALGTKTPDPWVPRDAFMASAMYLGDLGAGAQTYSSEKSAACKYYGGGSGCTTVSSPYGISVMQKAQNIQLNMIDPLN